MLYVLFEHYNKFEIRLFILLNVWFCSFMVEFVVESRSYRQGVEEAWQDARYSLPQNMAVAKCASVGEFGLLSVSAWTLRNQCKTICATLTKYMNDICNNVDFCWANFARWFDARNGTAFCQSVLQWTSYKCNGSIACTSKLF